MNINHAVIKLNPSVVTIRAGVAYDAEGNEVSYDKDAAEVYVNTRDYIAKRAAEYPPITDYLDGIVKGNQAQVQAYIDACLAVKQKYPKE